MRLSNPLQRRIEEMERLLTPPPKQHFFVSVEDEPGASSYEEQLAAFKIAHGVQPGDELFCLRLTYH